MPSSSTSLVTLPNSVSTPTCPVGTEVTEDHSRMSSTIPPTILPTPSDSQFFGAAMRSVGPRSPGPLLKTFMFASRQNFLRLAKRGDHCTWPRARGIRGSQKAACRVGLDQRVGTHQSFRSEERRVGKECRSRWSPYH